MRASLRSLGVMKNLFCLFIILANLVTGNCSLKPTPNHRIFTPQSGDYFVRVNKLNNYIEIIQISDLTIFNKFRPRNFSPSHSKFQLNNNFIVHIIGNDLISSINDDCIHIYNFKPRTPTNEELIHGLNGRYLTELEQKYGINEPNLIYKVNDITNTIHTEQTTACLKPQNKWYTSIAYLFSSTIVIDGFNNFTYYISLNEKEIEVTQRTTPDEAQSEYGINYYSFLIITNGLWIILVISYIIYKKVYPIKHLTKP